MPQNVASDQGLHCLPLIQQVLARMTSSKMDIQIFGEKKGRSYGVQIFRVNTVFLHDNIWYVYSFEVSYWDASNEYPQHMFACGNKKNISFSKKHILCVYIKNVSSKRF